VRSAQFATIELCPICNNTVKKLKQSLRTIVRSFDEVIESHYGYCSACEYAMCINRPNAEVLARYYSNNDQLRRDSLTVEAASHLMSQVSFMNGYINRGGNSLKILEIGPDFGALLGLVTQKFNGNGYFDELNLEAKKHLMRQGYIEAKQDSQEKFDLIIMTHIYEHVPDPIEFLKQNLNRLEESGSIFIEVPDYSALALGQSDLFQFEHLSYFSLQSIGRIAHKLGLYIAASESARTLNYSTTPNRVARVLLKKYNNSQSKLDSESLWNDLMSKTLKDFSTIDQFRRQHPQEIVALYGAGTRTLQYIANTGCGLDKLIIFDKDPKKIGTTLRGIEVRDPDTILSASFERIFLMVVGYQKEVRNYLSAMGIDSYKVDPLC
jgi:SAM-dependent methyltransferase